MKYKLKKMAVATLTVALGASSLPLNVLANNVVPEVESHVLSDNEAYEQGGYDEGEGVEEYFDPNAPVTADELLRMLEETFGAEIVEAILNNLSGEEDAVATSEGLELVTAGGEYSEEGVTDGSMNWLYEVVNTISQNESIINFLEGNFEEGATISLGAITETISSVTETLIEYGVIEEEAIDLTVEGDFGSDYEVTEINGTLTISGTEPVNIRNVVISGDLNISPSLANSLVTIQNVEVTGGLHIHSTNVSLAGVFNDVHVTQPNTSFRVLNTGGTGATPTRIANFNVLEEAAGSRISLGRGATIESIVIDAPVAISGTGNIEEATINSIGVTVTNPAIIQTEPVGTEAAVTTVTDWTPIDLVEAAIAEIIAEEAAQNEPPAAEEPPAVEESTSGDSDDQGSTDNEAPFEPPVISGPPVMVDGGGLLNINLQSDGTPVDGQSDALAAILNGLTFRGAPLSWQNGNFTINMGNGASLRIHVLNNRVVSVNVLDGEALLGAGTTTDLTLTIPNASVAGTAGLGTRHVLVEVSVTRAQVPITQIPADGSALTATLFSNGILTNNAALTSAFQGLRVNSQEIQWSSPTATPNYNVEVPFLNSAGGLTGAGVKFHFLGGELVNVNIVNGHNLAANSTVEGRLVIPNYLISTTSGIGSVNVITELSVTRGTTAQPAVQLTANIPIDLNYASTAVTNEAAIINALRALVFTDPEGTNRPLVWGSGTAGDHTLNFIGANGNPIVGANLVVNFAANGGLGSVQVNGIIPEGTESRLSIQNSSVTGTQGLNGRDIYTTSTVTIAQAPIADPIATTEGNIAIAFDVNGALATDTTALVDSLRSLRINGNTVKWEPGQRAIPFIVGGQNLTLNFTAGAVDSSPQDITEISVTGGSPYASTSLTDVIIAAEHIAAPNDASNRGITTDIAVTRATRPTINAYGGPITFKFAENSTLLNGSAIAGLLDNLKIENGVAGEGYDVVWGVNSHRIYFTNDQGAIIHPESWLIFNANGERSALPNVNLGGAALTEAKITAIRGLRIQNDSVATGTTGITDQDIRVNITTQQDRNLNNSNMALILNETGPTTLSNATEIANMLTALNSTNISWTITDTGGGNGATRNIPIYNGSGNPTAYDLQITVTSTGIVSNVANDLAIVVRETGAAINLTSNGLADGNNFSLRVPADHTAEGVNIATLPIAVRSLPGSAVTIASPIGLDITRADIIALRGSEQPARDAALVNVVITNTANRDRIIDALNGLQVLGADLRWTQETGSPTHHAITIGTNANGTAPLMTLNVTTTEGANGRRVVNTITSATIKASANLSTITRNQSFHALVPGSAVENFTVPIIANATVDFTIAEAAPKPPGETNLSGERVAIVLATDYAAGETAAPVTSGGLAASNTLGGHKDIVAQLNALTKGSVSVGGVAITWENNGSHHDFRIYNTTETAAPTPYYLRVTLSGSGNTVETVVLHRSGDSSTSGALTEGENFSLGIPAAAHTGNDNLTVPLSIRKLGTPSIATTTAIPSLVVNNTDLEALATANSTNGDTRRDALTSILKTAANEAGLKAALNSLQAFGTASKNNLDWIQTNSDGSPAHHIVTIHENAISSAPILATLHVTTNGTGVQTVMVNSADAGLANLRGRTLYANIPNSAVNNHGAHVRARINIQSVLREADKTESSRGAIVLDKTGNALASTDISGFNTWLAGLAGTVLTNNGTHYLPIFNGVVPVGGVSHIAVDDETPADGNGPVAYLKVTVGSDAITGTTITTTTPVGLFDTEAGGGDPVPPAPNGNILLDGNNFHVVIPRTLTNATTGTITAPLAVRSLPDTLATTKGGGTPLILRATANPQQGGDGVVTLETTSIDKINGALRGLKLDLEGDDANALIPWNISASDQIIRIYNTPVDKGSYSVSGPSHMATLGLTFNSNNSNEITAGVLTLVGDFAAIHGMCHFTAIIPNTAVYNHGVDIRVEFQATLNNAGLGNTAILSNEIIPIIVENTTYEGSYITTENLNTIISGLSNIVAEDSVVTLNDALHNISLFTSEYDALEGINEALELTAYVNNSVVTSFALSQEGFNDGRFYALLTRDMTNKDFDVIVVFEVTNNMQDLILVPLLPPVLKDEVEKEHDIYEYSTDEYKENESVEENEYEGNDYKADKPSDDYDGYEYENGYGHENESENVEVEAEENESANDYGNEDSYKNENVYEDGYENGYVYEEGDKSLEDYEDEEGETKQSSGRETRI